MAVEKQGINNNKSIFNKQYFNHIIWVMGSNPWPKNDKNAGATSIYLIFNCEIGVGGDVLFLEYKNGKLNMKLYRAGEAGV